MKNTFSAALIDPPAPLRVKVNVPLVGPASVAVASVATIVTVGVKSSSVMVTVAVLGAPTVYAASGVRVSSTPSSPSTAASSIGVIVSVTLASPGRIVTTPGIPG